jgi:peptidoglycan/LPS O-acetylase OafA/YrhL
MTAALIPLPSPAANAGEVFPLGLTPGPIGHRFTVLDSLRGISALMVCLFHFTTNGPIADMPLVQGSWLFVDFFFVLSGFVIAANYRQKLMAGGFLRGFVVLRFGRVYPLHLAMLLVFVAMEAAAALFGVSGAGKRAMFEGHHSVAAIFTNATLLQSFGLHDGLTWNKPAWSVAVEFWTYLLFAQLVRTVGTALEKWLAVIVVGCIATLLVATPHGLNVTYSLGIVRCMYGFAVGALAWWAWQAADHVPFRPYRLASIIEIGAVAAVVAFVSLGAEGPANLLAPALFAGAILVFARAGGRVSQWLLAPPLRHLGLLSFSIYMVHTFAQARFADVLRLIERLTRIDLVGSETTATGKVVAVIGVTPVQSVVLTLVMLALVVAVSQLTWRWIEVPGQKWARRRAASA